MTDPPSHPIVRRPIPGSRHFVSAITVTVDPPRVAPPSSDARAVALLQRARERGVTTFDVAGARHPERAERLIARAFPSMDSELGVIVRRSVESIAREAGASESASTTGDLATAVSRSLETSQKRLAPVPIVLVEWEPRDETAVGGPSRFDPETYFDGRIAGPAWATCVDPSVTSLPSPAGPSALFTGDFSLLDERIVRLFEDPSRSPLARLLARDPFAGGRLDGSRFAATAALSGPGSGPVDLRRLHTEFDPVLPLGFLTEGHRRTLPQAALHFVLGWPWAVTAVVPLPEPGRFEEVLGWDAAPPLTDEEWRRLGFVK